MKRYTEAELQEMPNKDRLAHYNGVVVPALQNIGVPVKETKRFADSKACIRAILLSYADLDDGKSSRRKFKATKDTTADNKPAAKPETKSKKLNGSAPEAPKVDAPPAPRTRRSSGTNTQPRAINKIYPAIIGTKQSILIDLLSRKEGATFSELHAAMQGGAKPWAEITTKSALGWDVHHVKGYGVRTTFLNKEEMKSSGRTSEAKYVLEGDRIPVYHLRLPEGMKKPLAHVTRSEYANWTPTKK